MQKPTFRLILILLMVLTIALVVKANPAEYLNNPSFAGGITGWTVGYVGQGAGSIIEYDGTYCEDSAGSLKGATGVGKKIILQGFAEQTIGIDINSTDIVTLSLNYHKRSVTGPARLFDVKAQIAKPNTPTVWDDIWSNTDIPAENGAPDGCPGTGWTAVSSLDVSTYFDETGTYKFRWYFDLEAANDALGQALMWFDSTSLDVVEGPSLTCSVEPSFLSFGTLTIGLVSETTDTATTTITSGDAFYLTIHDWGNGTDPGLYGATTTGQDIIVSPNATKDATTTLQAGIEGYGIRAATTTDGITLTQRYRTLYLDIWGTNTVGGLNTTSTAITMASSTGAVTDGKVVITHKAAISASTEIGDYKDTIIYTCYSY